MSTYSSWIHWWCFPIPFTSFFPRTSSLSISLIGSPIYSSPHSNQFFLLSSHLFIYFFLLWEQKSLFSLHPFSLSFIKPIPLIHFSVSSPRIRLIMALTQCWWRARNITWGYVTHFCLISTHSSTKPTPRGRLFYVLSCTSKSYFIIPDQTSNQPFIANIYAVRFGEKK